MKTIVLFFFIVGIVMLTIGYNNDKIKEKENEIHTVEYRYIPQNLYELQMNPALGNQNVESNFQHMFQGQSPFFDEDLYEKGNRAEELRKKRNKELMKQNTIREFIDILFSFIEASKSEIDVEDYNELKGIITEILNEFDIMAISRNQVLRNKDDILVHLNKIVDSKYTKYKRILKRFFNPGLQESIDTFLFNLFYGRVYRRNEETSELIIIDREGEISFTPDEIGMLRPILVDLLNSFPITSNNRNKLREYKNKIIDNMKSISDFNQFKKKIKKI